jgi:hypothetical protein
MGFVFIVAGVAFGAELAVEACGGLLRGLGFGGGVGEAALWREGGGISCRYCWREKGRRKVLTGGMVATFLAGRRSI